MPALARAAASRGFSRCEMSRTGVGCAGHFTAKVVDRWTAGLM
jgi:hypothetical protein